MALPMDYTICDVLLSFLIRSCLMLFRMVYIITNSSLPIAVCTCWCLPTGHAQLCVHVLVLVCVWHICTDVKLPLPFYIYIYISICGGSPGSRGGRWSTKTPPRDPCKRTRGTVVTHLGAYKTQLVVTIVPYIYIFKFIRFHPYICN